MYFARLAPAVLLLGSLAAFSQDQGRQNTTSTTNRQAPQDTVQQTSPSEPWRIIPRHELNPEWLQDAAAEYRKSHSELFATDHELINGPLCFNIRSYVVARDEKDSDSTHTVGSSTCQLASRFQLKSANH